MWSPFPSASASAATIRLSTPEARCQAATFAGPISSNSVIVGTAGCRRERNERRGWTTHSANSARMPSASKLRSLSNGVASRIECPVARGWGMDTFSRRHRRGLRDSGSTRAASNLAASQPHPRMGHSASVNSGDGVKGFVTEPLCLTVTEPSLNPPSDRGLGCDDAVLHRPATDARAPVAALSRRPLTADPRPCLIAFGRRCSPSAAPDHRSMALGDRLAHHGRQALSGPETSHASPGWSARGCSMPARWSRPGGVGPTRPPAAGAVGGQPVRTR